MLTLRSGLWMALFLFTCTRTAGAARADDPWVVYQGKDGPGQGKHIVLVTGDEEYRSEESMPQLARILAQRHGFTCTVLFAIDRKDGTINPQQLDNIPGLEKLPTAHLMVVFLRFRDLPDEQMEYIVDYLELGKPVVGLRTATHAFNNPNSPRFAKYHWQSKVEGYEQGFGRQVLGETWISHHGQHGKQSTRGVPAPGQEGGGVWARAIGGEITTKNTR